MNPTKQYRIGLRIVLSMLLAIGILWVSFPDVSYLRTENPQTTAYIEMYKRRAAERGKRPVIMMRWTPLNDISPNLQNAVVISEDDMFFRHHGIDWGAMRHALRYDWQKGRMVRGGSTITQQVARNLFLSPIRSPLRKLREMVIAWKLERTLTKKRILEIYLNVAEWGVGIYGAQAASEIYFGKNVSDLTPEEAVQLASALPSPWRLNPAKEPGPKLVRRREVILGRMRRAGYLPVEVKLSEIEVPGDIDASNGNGDGEAAQPPTEASPKRPIHADSAKDPKKTQPENDVDPAVLIH